MSNNKVIDTSTTAGKIAVMQAHEGGKKIQALFVAPNTEWHDSPHPSWDWANFDYRIEPEPEEIWVVSWTQLSTERQAVYGSKDAAKRFIDDILRGTCAHNFKITKFIEATTE